MKKISTTNAPAAIGPYSQGMILGNLVFSSGQIPVDPKTGAVLRQCGRGAEGGRIFSG